MLALLLAIIILLRRTFCIIDEITDKIKQPWILMRLAGYISYLAYYIGPSIDFFLTPKHILHNT